MKGYIYRIQIGDYFYFGQTTNLPKRQYNHLSSLRSSTHRNKFMQRVFDKLGEEALTIQVYITCPVEFLDCLEQHLIDSYIKDEKCMNLAPEVGTTRGYRFNEDQLWARRKFDLATEQQICYTYTVSGIARIADAYSVSEKTVRDILNRHGVETRSKGKNVNPRSFVMSEEQKQKLSEVKRSISNEDDSQVRDLYLSGLSMREIGEIMNISEKTIRNSLKRTETPSRKGGFAYIYGKNSLREVQ